MGPDLELDLIRRVAKGDRDAFAEIYERYYTRLFRFVARLTPSVDIAEEVVNDVMVVVWRTAGRFQEASRPSTWILGIGYRTALKRSRRQRRLGEQELDDEFPSRQDDAEAVFARREKGWKVQRALEKLSPEHRAVVQLTLFDEFSYAQIAKIVDCPENTVKTRMFHARRHLKRLLNAQDPTCEEPR
jgi:RNA polymerase sigma-70 factor (ECF subfamily)